MSTAKLSTTLEENTSCQPLLLKKIILVEEQPRVHNLIYNEIKWIHLSNYIKFIVYFVEIIVCSFRKSIDSFNLFVLLDNTNYETTKTTE